MFEKLFIDSFPGFLSIRNENHEIVYLNKNFENWIKSFVDINPIGKKNEDLAKLVSPEVAHVFTECHDASICWQKNCNSNESLKKIIEFKNKTYSQFFEIWKYGQLINGENYIFTVGFDITHMYLENKEYLEASITDSLTKAYNRVYLKSNFNKFKGFKGVLIDLDNFKTINDYEGHNTGDKILIEFVNMIKDNLTEVESIIRMGGDEFLLIFDKNINQERLYINMLELRSTFKKHFENYKYLSFSFGINDILGDLEATIECLDEKMYLDKRNRKSIFR